MTFFDGMADWELRFYAKYSVGPKRSFASALPLTALPNRPFYRNYLPSVLRLKDTNIGLTGFLKNQGLQ
jgi:hypothetical protein